MLLSRLLLDMSGPTRLSNIGFHTIMLNDALHRGPQPHPVGDASEILILLRGSATLYTTV